MKNFPFPQESNDFDGRRQRPPHARHHHDPGSPTGDDDFPGGPGGPDPGFDDDGPRGGGRSRGRGFGRGGRRGPGFGPGFGPQGPDGPDGPDDFGPGFGTGPGGPHFGPGPRFGPGGPRFGPGPGFGPGGFGPGPGGRGGRVRKGNVRSAILSLLSQHSYNGYGLIRAIAIHTDGAWHPSPGSVYPTLAALQSEGLIHSSEEGRRTEFSLTEAGKAYVAENSDEMAQVWADVNEEAGAGTELRAGMHKLGGAVQQIAMAGTEEQIKGATEALDAARRTIYQLLAD